MVDKYYEIRNSDNILNISSPSEASSNARYIVRESIQSVCNSYSYSKFHFIDNEGNEISIEFNDAKVNKVYINGTAGDYVLNIEIVECGEVHKYSYHDDIRYNILPLCGPKAFKPQFMEWDRYNPLITVMNCLDRIKQFGVEAFDVIFALESECRMLKTKYERLEVDNDLIKSGLKDVEQLELAEGTTQLKPYGFCDLYKLHTIILPSTLEEIMAYSLCHCSVKTIYCKSIEPPKFDFFAFGEGASISELTIYIPINTLESYKNAWKKYDKQFHFVEFDYDDCK